MILADNVARLEIVGQLDIDAGPAALEFSPDRRLIGFATESGKLMLWDLRSGLQVLRLETFLGSGGGSAPSIAYPELGFSPDGSRVAATFERLEQVNGAEVHAGGVGIWPTDGSSDPVLLEPTWLYATTVDFSPDGRLIAVGTRDGLMAQGGRLILFEAQSGDVAHSIDIPGEGVSDLAFSPDGSLIALAGHMGEVGLWNAVGWAHVGGIAVSSPRLAFSPDGSTIALSDGSIWSVDILEKTGALPSGRFHIFSPDGELVVSGNGGLMISGLPSSQQVGREGRGGGGDRGRRFLV